MSTKIYYAYRTKNKNLSRFLTELQQKKNTIKEEAMRCVALGLAKPDYIERDFQSREFIIEHMRKRTTAFYELCKETSVSITIDSDGYTYIKLFGDYEYMNKFCKWLNESGYIEDYHYQNQTDAPNGISEEDFSARGDKWDRITGGVTYSCMLNIILVPDFLLESWNYDFVRLVEKMREGRKIK